VVDWKLQPFRQFQCSQVLLLPTVELVVYLLLLPYLELHLQKLSNCFDWRFLLLWHLQDPCFLLILHYLHVGYQNLVRWLLHHLLELSPQKQRHFAEPFPRYQLLWHLLFLLLIPGSALLEHRELAPLTSHHVMELSPQRQTHCSFGRFLELFHAQGHRCLLAILDSDLLDHHSLTHQLAQF